MRTSSDDLLPVVGMVGMRGVKKLVRGTVAKHLAYPLLVLKSVLDRRNRCDFDDLSDVPGRLIDPTSHPRIHRRAGRVGSELGKTMPVVGMVGMRGVEEVARGDAGVVGKHPLLEVGAVPGDERSRQFDEPSVMPGWPDHATNDRSRCHGSRWETRSERERETMLVVGVVGRRKLR